MQISTPCVVSLSWKLEDAQGRLIDELAQPLEFLFGGDDLFTKVEEVLNGQEAGFETGVALEPEDAFGEYDSGLVCFEARSLMPENIEVGMQFEGEDPTGDVVLYTITDIADGKVVVDGNHPWAGERVNFKATVTGIRPATKEEINHGHVHGAGGHHH